MQHADVAARAVAAIRARLMVDPEWAVDLPDGFAWWAYDVRQEITARAESGVPEEPRAWVLIRTELARDVTATGAERARIVAGLNARPLGGAARVLPDRRLVIEAAFPASDATIARVVHAAATAAILALTVGRYLVKDQLADLRGSLAVCPHPVNGWRDAPDQMLDLPLQFPFFAMQLEMQGGPNPWSQPDEWAEAVQSVNTFRVGFSTGGDRALSAQFPLYDRDRGAGPTAMLHGDVPTALLRGDWLPSTDIGGVGELGPGLLLRLFLPTLAVPGSGTPEQAAATLNAAEVEQGGAAREVWPTHIGAWTLQPGLGRELLVAYVLWVPAMLASRITLADLVLQQGYRARNVAGWLRRG